MNSREQFEKWMGIKMSGHAHDFGLEVWQASRAQALEDAINAIQPNATPMEAAAAIRQMKGE